MALEPKAPLCLTGEGQAEHWGTGENSHNLKKPASVCPAKFDVFKSSQLSRESPDFYLKSPAI